MQAEKRTRGLWATRYIASLDKEQQVYAESVIHAAECGELDVREVWPSLTTLMGGWKGGEKRKS